MNIVILNECFFKEKHLKELRKLGNLAVFSDTDSEQKAIERMKGADIVIADTFICPLNSNVLSKTRNLKFLALNTTGYDPVDLTAAKKMGIAVANVPDFCTESVAEHVIALMFALAKKIPLGNEEMHQHIYEADPASQKTRKFLALDIHKKTMGIIGFGNIGKCVAKLANGLGMRVIAYSRSKKDIDHVEFMPLKDVLKQSDVISINMSLSKDTENILGKKEFSLMKPSAIIINTARGKLIDTNALYDALKNKTIAGAGLDIIADAKDNHPILKLENVILTPHIAWYSQESLDNLADKIVLNVKSYVKGKPINLISE